MTEPDRTADRLDIAEALYRYAEAVDILGSNPTRPADPDPALGRAVDVLKTCLTDDGVVRLLFEGREGPGPPAGDGGPDNFARFVRSYFTTYGYVGTYHLVGNVRVSFTGPDAARVRSYINSTHWMADHRLLFAPIDYEDTVIRLAGTWKIAARDIVVWRWGGTDGYTPV